MGSHWEQEREKMQEREQGRESRWTARARRRDKSSIDRVMEGCKPEWILKLIIVSKLALPAAVAMAMSKVAALMRKAAARGARVVARSRADALDVTSVIQG